MAFSQSANSIEPTTPPSGIYKLPKLLPLPEFLDSSHLPMLENIICYVQDHPGNDIFTLLVYRDRADDSVYILTGERDGQTIDFNSELDDRKKLIAEFIKEKSIEILSLMRIVKIDQAQYYFSINQGKIILQDIRTAMNKFMGPGFVRDMFNAIVNVPNIRKIEILSSNNLEAIMKNTGSFNGDIIIKPSRFRLYDEINDDNVPLVVECLR